MLVVNENSARVGPGAARPENRVSLQDREFLMAQVKNNTSLKPAPTADARAVAVTGDTEAGGSAAVGHTGPKLHPSLTALPFFALSGFLFLFNIVPGTGLVATVATVATSFSRLVPYRGPYQQRIATIATLATRHMPERTAWPK